MWFRISLDREMFCVKFPGAVKRFYWNTKRWYDYASYMTEPTEAIITISGRRVPYRVVRSTRARRLRVTVKEGQVTVTLPRGVRESEAERLLQQHGAWLLKHLDAPTRRKKPAQTLPADVILLRGTAHRIEVIEEPERLSRLRVEEKSGRLLVRVPPGTREPPRRLVVPWLKAQARLIIEASVRRQSACMSVTYKIISIRDQRTRWGSCSNQGSLSFNWRLVMAPPAVLEYVVVHELAHRRQQNHSKAFWQVVAQYYPDFKAARAWLRANASLLRPHDTL